MLVRKLFRTAWNYKSQFISMIIMIAIGVGIFIGFNIEWKSLENDVFSFFEETNYADFRLYSETGFSEDDIKSIKNIDGEDAATRYFNVNVSIKNTKKSVALNVSEDYTVSTMTVMQGAEYDKNFDGIWLSDKFADVNNIKIGDLLTFTYKGIEISDKVVGLVKSSENLICVADENQIMPDYNSFGFAYISPKTLENAIKTPFYPQINIISNLDKATLEQKIKEVTGTTFLVTDKKEHYAYAGVMSECEEGKTMGSILPVLFLAIAILTMITTMHRISANEKVQIGTLKSLGFRNKRILLHYTSYGFVIGIIGTALGIAIGYLIAAVIISPNGMMGTYLDMPNWNLSMPEFCIPVLVLMLAFMTFISFLSVKKMLKGTAADTLKPYTPKVMKKSKIERFKSWNKLSFGTKWNIRDIFRHKSRSAMTLLGVLGCTVLLVGGLGMKDTMQNFLNMLDKDISNYNTKIILSESATNQDAITIADDLKGDWQSSSGISYGGKTVTLDIYSANNGKIGFLTESNKHLKLDNNGVYLCLRLKDTANVGDTVEFSPYGSEKTYKVKVAGYIRSLVSECVVMTDTYADNIGIDYKINSVYTDTLSDKIENSEIISAKQDKNTIMKSYDTFMEIMNVMIVVLVIAAVVLGIVVLYNLGIMNYVERSRELATLKVLGFRDRQIGNLLISQNMWLTVLGLLIGIPAGVGVLKFLIVALASEYELSITIGMLTYAVSILLTFGVSLIVGVMVAKKTPKINMVEALKNAE